MTVVAALQIGSDHRGKSATLDNILAWEDRVSGSGASLVVMPEALLGGYPKGETFGTGLGYRVEGRCFVISACQVQPSPRALGIAVPKWDDDRPLIRGGSMIVGPYGGVLAGPAEDGPALVTAEIDIGELAKARYDLDVTGHYARPDIFSLSVDETARDGVRWIDS